MTDTDTTLLIDRVFKASPERVFAAWTQTDEIARWYGPETMRAEIFENDLVPGGRYRMVMRSSEGEEYHLSGEYREIDPPKKLVMTWKWATAEEATLVTIELRPEGDGTHLRLTHSGFADIAGRDNHNQGWSSSLNDLERALA